MKHATFRLLILLVFNGLNLHAQTLGGTAAYNFLRLPGSPQLSALGGVNISNISNDIALSFNNPALLRLASHAQFSANFNSLYSGVKNYQVITGYHIEKKGVNLAIGLHYVDYGTLAQTDASGNVLGSFRPGDYSIQVSASKAYLNRWHYGFTLKYIHSNYGLYKSAAVALDAGVAYYDSSAAFQAALVIKNMGAQLSYYDGSKGEDLPFDLQLGISKRLQNAPLQFSLTAHHLHRFDIRYNDSVFNNANSFPGKEKSTLDNIFRHLVLAAQAYAGDKVEVSIAYNYLRRAELGIPNTTNGLNGFSLGAGVLFRRLQIRYARSYYQNSRAYNQFGLNLSMNDFFGLGHFGERVGW